MKTRFTIKKLISVALVLSMILTFGALAEKQEKASLWFDTPLKITWMHEENVTIPLSNDVLVIQKLKELLNVELDIQGVPESDYTTKISTLLATNNIPDVLDINDNSMKQYADSGMFVSLTEKGDLASTYLALVEDDSRASDTATFKVDGHLYGFRVLERNRIAVSPLPIIRMDLLEKLNLEIPQTWDELYQVLLAIKADAPDKYVFSTRNGTNYLIGNLAYPLGAGGFSAGATTRGMYLEPQSDKWLFGPTTDTFKAVVSFLAKAYADGLLHPDYAIMTRDMLHERLSSGELVFNYDNTTFSNAFNIALAEKDPNARFDMLNPMVNQFGQTRAERFNRDWSTFSVISTKADRGDDIIKFFDWLYTDEGVLLTNYGVEGITFDYVDGKPRLRDEVMELGDYAQIRAKYGLGTFFSAKYVDETGNLDMMRYIGEKNNLIPVNISQSERITALTDEGIIRYKPLYPAFTAAETEQITNLETRLSASFDQEIDKFITGVRSLDEYDSFIEDLKKLGVEELEKIYNDAYIQQK